MAPVATVIRMTATTNRAALLAVVLAFLPSCAALRSIRDATNSGAIAAAKQREMQTQQDVDTRIALQAALVPGATLTATQATWGPPDATEFERGRAFHWYRNGDSPMFLVYEEDKLVGWHHDREGAERFRQSEQQAQQQREIADDERRQAVGTALQGIGRAFQDAGTR